MYNVHIWSVGAMSLPSTQNTTECPEWRMSSSLWQNVCRSENVAIKIIPGNKQFSFRFVSVRFLFASNVYLYQLYNSNIAKYRHSSFDALASDGLIRAPDTRTLSPLISFSSFSILFFFALSALNRIAEENKAVQCVCISECARMWHEYSFGFEIAYRCLIRWLRKRYWWNLFYIFRWLDANEILVGVVFSSFFQNYARIASISMWSECAKFQSVSILFKRFTFFSHGFYFPPLSLTLAFHFNRNRFVINCWLLMYVWTFTAEHLSDACDSKHEFCCIEIRKSLHIILLSCAHIHTHTKV